MKVEYKGGVTIEDMKPGECFRFSNEIFIKTDYETEGYIACVSLESGVYSKFPPKLETKIENAKVVIG